MTWAMPSVRGIVVVLTGLLLAGCMQSGPVFDANFTARDRQQLTNPPYQQAWIAPAYRRQVVDYHRKESPGSIVVDTDARYVYYVLPDGKAIRYGAIVGEKPWAGVASVGRKEEWPGWTPTEGEKRRLGPLPNYVEGGASNPRGRARSTSTPMARTRSIASTARTSRDGSDTRFRRAASG